MSAKQTMDLDFLVTEMSLSRDYLVLSRVDSDGSGKPRFEVDSLDFCVEDATWGSFTVYGETVDEALQEYHDRYLGMQKERAEAENGGDD